MSRLSLRLPKTLHRQLADQARHEGVSLNQYLVYLLSRHSAPTYSVVPSNETAAEQLAAFERLRTELGSAPVEVIEQVLAEREEAGPEAGWSTALRARFEQSLSRARKRSSS